MGNFKFRLSDMIPNAWLHKLKDMGAKATGTDNNSLKKKQKKMKMRPPPKPMESSSSPPPGAGAATTTYTPKSPKLVLHSNTHYLHNNPYPRKTYYFSRELLKNDSLAPLNSPDPPRRSSKHRVRRRTSAVSPKRVSSSVSAGCSCRTTLRAKLVGNSPPELSSPDEGSTITTEETEAANSLVFRPELIRSDRLLVTHSFDQMLSIPTPDCTKIESDSSNDVVIDVQPESCCQVMNPPVSEVALSPIVTKLVTKVEDKSFTTDQLKPNLVGVRVPEQRIPKEKKSSKKERGKPEEIEAPSMVKQRTRSAGSNYHNNSAQSPGIRLRINSPRIASRRSFHQAQGRKSLSSSTTTSSRSSSSSSRKSLSASSLAVVKSSFDPQRDFRESMVEMIVENNLRGSKDLEDLLACYLSLNADEYHELIIKVFKQIWFDLTRANPKVK